MAFLKLLVVGNLGRDPEMQYSANGDPVTHFSVASKVGFADREKTIWLRCTAFGKLAENINEYTNKGSQVYFEGELEVDPDTGGPKLWETKDGETRASYEVLVRTLHFLDRKSDRTDNEDRSSRSSSSSSKPKHKPPKTEEYDEDNIPF